MSTVCCSSGSPDTTSIDFIGEVVAADTSNWEIDADNPDIAFTSGGPESRFRVGPATFRLADGTTLEVPAATPGGNVCSLLGFPDQPRTPTCLIAGGLDDAGAVDWFSIEPLDKNPDGTFALGTDRFDGRDAIVRIGGTRIARPVPTDATLLCAEPGDLSSTPIDVPASSALVLMNGDMEVVRIECLYAE